MLIGLQEPVHVKHLEQRLALSEHHVSVSFYDGYFKASFGHELQPQNHVTQITGYKST